MTSIVADRFKRISSLVEVGVTEPIQRVRIGWFDAGPVGHVHFVN